jgi:hypothetical protein
LKTILKLLVAIAVLNAVGRGGMAALSYFQFKDETERLIVFDVASTPDELKSQILTIGSRHGLAVVPEDVSVERQGSRTTASAGYTAVVEYFPRYTYAMPVSFTVEAFSAGPLKPGATR